MRVWFELCKSCPLRPMLTRLEKFIDFSSVYLGRSVVDPDSLNPDPNTDKDPPIQVNPDPDTDSGFWWPEIEKRYNWFLFFIFWTKFKKRPPRTSKLQAKPSVLRICIHEPHRIQIQSRYESRCTTLPGRYQNGEKPVICIKKEQRRNPFLPFTWLNFLRCLFNKKNFSNLAPFSN